MLVLQGEGGHVSWVRSSTMCSFHCLIVSPINISSPPALDYESLCMVLSPPPELIKVDENTHTLNNTVWVFISSVIFVEAFVVFLYLLIWSADYSLSIVLKGLLLHLDSLPSLLVWATFHHCILQLLKQLMTWKLSIQTNDFHFKSVHISNTFPKSVSILGF